MATKKSPEAQVLLNECQQLQAANAHMENMFMAGCTGVLTMNLATMAWMGSTPSTHPLAHGLVVAVVWSLTATMLPSLKHNMRIRRLRMVRYDHIAGRLRHTNSGAEDLDFTDLVFGQGGKYHRKYIAAGIYLFLAMLPVLFALRWLGWLGGA